MRRHPFDATLPPLMLDLGLGQAYQPGTAPPLKIVSAAFATSGD